VVGACVGGVVAVGATAAALVGTVVGAALVAVAAGFVAVGATALLDGFLVAVGAGALLFAVLEDGLLVAVGSGSPSEDAFAALVAVGDGSCWAAPGAPEPSAASWSSGAAGGGFSAPVDDGDPLPLRLATAWGVSVAELPPPRMPLAMRPPEMVSVPPATNAMAIAFGLMTSLLVPRPADSLEATSVRQAEGVSCGPPFPGRPHRVLSYK
jgi:hypothetical protein